MKITTIDLRYNYSGFDVKSEIMETILSRYMGSGFATFPNINGQDFPQPQLRAQGWVAAIRNDHRAGAKGDHKHVMKQVPGVVTTRVSDTVEMFGEGDIVSMGHSVTSLCNLLKCLSINVVNAEYRKSLDLLNYFIVLFESFLLS